MYKKWTEEEVLLLKFVYPNENFTMDEIIKIFDDRNKVQIQLKASRLGLKRYKEEIQDGYKRCSRCQTILPLDDFYNTKRNKDGKSSNCKICHSKYRWNRYKLDRQNKNNG